MRQIFVLCVVAVLLATGVSLDFSSLTVDHGYKQLSDENSCLFSLHNQMGNTLTTTTIGVVGLGWDDLTNKMTLPVFSTKFEKCKTTPDGHFLIPDNVLAIPVQEVFIDRSARSYKSYDDVEKESIRADRKEFSSFVGGGAFSTGNQEVKKHFSNGNTVMMEAQIGYKAFIFIAEAEELDLAFQIKIDEIIESLNQGLLTLAKYQAECIIRDYGTHVVNKALTGASMKYKGFIKSDGAHVHDGSMSQMESSFAVSFLGLVGGGDKSTSEGSVFQKSGSEAHFQHTIIETKGGADVRKILNSKDDDGLKGMDHIVGLEHEGTPIYLIIHKSYFPSSKYNTSILLNVQHLILNATKEYYSANTVPGCTDPTAKNFNFEANIDAGNCSASRPEFLFDGVFQRCDTVNIDASEFFYRGLKIYLEPQIRQLRNYYTTNHPLTKNTSCPEGYEEILLKSSNAYHHGSLTHRIQYGPIILLRNIRVKDVSIRIDYNTYWCRRKGDTKTAHDGALFGGFVVNGENIITKAPGCPNGFNGNLLFGDVKVCLCYDYDTGKHHSIPFGGLYSCESEEKKCPDGYSAHLLKFVDGCGIFYCVLPNVHNSYNPILNRPPFISYTDALANIANEIPPELINGTISTITKTVNVTDQVNGIQLNVL